MTRSGSLRTFLCCGEDGGGSRSPVVPASGRVELPVTEFGVHRPREFLGRDDFAVVWKLREDTTDCYFPRAWAERKRRLRRAPDIARVLIGRPPAKRAARASSAHTSERHAPSRRRMWAEAARPATARSRAQPFKIGGRSTWCCWHDGGHSAPCSRPCWTRRPYRRPDRCGRVAHIPRLVRASSPSGCSLGRTTAAPRLPAQPGSPTLPLVLIISSDGQLGTPIAVPTWAACRIARHSLPDAGPTGLVEASPMSPPCGREEGTVPGVALG